MVFLIGNDFEIELNNDKILIATEKVIVMKEQKITVADVEKTLKKLLYSGQKRIKDPAVESARLPSFVKLFYRFIAEGGCIPNEMFFTETYLNTYFFKTKKGLYYLKPSYNQMHETQYFTREGLEGRILRAYPSIIRDFHFFLLCVESHKFDRVIYSTYLDLRKGIDLKIIKDNECYAVSLYVETNRSKMYKQQKYKRHDYSGLKEICISLDLSKAKKVGNFALYGYSAIRNILSRIEDYNKTANIREKRVFPLCT